MRRNRSINWLTTVAVLALVPWADGPAAEPAAASSDNAFKAVNHWAFRKLLQPTPPRVKHAHRVRRPIDAFLLARLEPLGLSLAPDAEGVRLVRRVSFDLTGLPPSPELIDRFVADRRPAAFPRLVEELLASPDFGVRWGRHWLDIVGYTDTISFDDDYNKPIGFLENKWRFRDYVVEAFNADKPYDQFLTEQLAGDELVAWRTAETFTPEIREKLIATGFYRCCEDISKEDNRPFIIWSVLHDTVEQIGTSLLGLTLQCSRCHDHKFEPIPQTDYYGLMAIVTPALNPRAWKNPEQRALPDISPKNVALLNKRNAEYDAEIARRKKEIAALKKPADGKKIAELNRRIAELNSSKKSYGRLQAIYDVGKPPVTHLLKRGDYRTPGGVVPPGFLSLLSDAGSAKLLAAKPPEGSSGRRLAFAKWLTDPGSPASGLVARVMVNRVWQHLLGEGLAPTSENVGLSGVPPRHPQLIDWLAADFIEHRWQIKRLIRQIVTSSVYRQASSLKRSGRGTATGGVRQTPATKARSIDPDNRLLWRARLRRLEAEAIRDAILSAAGTLDRSLGGPPVPLEYRPNGTVLVATKGLPSPTSRWRRTLFLLNRRIYNPSFLSVFDKPIVTAGVCRRDPAAVALQSLAMMNDTLVVEQSEQVALRVIRQAGDLPRRQIELAFRLVLGRRPQDVEVSWCRELLEQQASNFTAAKRSPEDARRLALAELCQTLFNTSEFLYLE